MKIDSIQKGFYKAKVGDVILSNRTTERKAKDDGINYCLANGLDSYTIIFPDLVEVALEGAETEVVVVPPIEEKTLLEEMIARGLDVPTSGIIESLEITVSYKDNDIIKIQLRDLDITNDLIYNKHVQIINPEVLVNAYYLDPVEAGITEGVVSDTIALANTVAMNAELDKAEVAGNTTFVVPNTMDAYFETGGNGNGTQTRALNVDSSIILRDNMHFKMGTNTVLRRQPNSFFSSNLLSAIWKSGDATRTGENIKVSGGTLIGDIRDHFYEQTVQVATPVSASLIAKIAIVRDYATTVYDVPVTISDATTNASEIATWLNDVADLNASANGDEITIDAGAGVYLLIDDADSDTSGISLGASEKASHEYGFGIAFYGCWDAIVQDVYIKDFHGDGIFLDKTGLRNTDGTLNAGLRTCENILIQRVTCDNNRRQGMSFVDTNGYEKGVALAFPGGIGSRIGVTVDDCDIINTGKELFTSPGYGIDCESYRIRNEDGSLSEYARVEHIIVKNSRFSGNIKGDLNLYNSQYFEVFNNSFTYKVSHVASHNGSIHDNTFTYDKITYPANTNNSVAIALYGYVISQTGEQLVHDIEIYNNIINGYTFGIMVSGDRFNVYSNNISNLNPNGGVGIRLNDELDDSTFHDNIINISGPDVIGYESWISGIVDIKSLTMYNETVTAGGNGKGIRLRNVVGSGTGINITNSSFSGGLRDVEVIDSENITFGAGNTYTIVNASGNTNVVIPTP